MKLDYCSYTAPLDRAQIDTPLEIVNQLLDNLPSEIWKNKDITFLDPCVKTGRFLTQIYLRLMDGLSQEIPDNYQRSNHILTQQLYGIGITKIQAMRSRKNLYGTKNANKSFLAQFTTIDGNIKYERDLINRNTINNFNFKGVFNMNFDIIIGNPPYQEMDGGAQASAIPLYNIFIERAKQLQPQYISMIIPDRWITGGRGLDGFRTSMLNDTHISYFYDYENSKECFPTVDIKGGICYFLWDKNYNNKCKIIKKNNNEEKIVEGFLNEPGIFSIGLTEINNKVSSNSDTFIETIASTQRPYGIRGDAFSNPAKYNLPPFEITPQNNGYKIIGRENNKRVWKYMKSDFIFSKQGLISNYKVFIPRNFGSGKIGEMPPQPIIAKPNECCTETFIELGPFQSEQEAKNFLSYFKTKFFRALMSIQKKDQGAARKIYKYIPIQDFSKAWSDKELYEKYNLTEQEQNYIETIIPEID